MAGYAKGYGDFLKQRATGSEEEETDITQMSEEDKKKLAIKRRLQKTRKVKP